MEAVRNMSQVTAVSCCRHYIEYQTFELEPAMSQEWEPVA